MRSSDEFLAKAAEDLTTFSTQSNRTTVDTSDVERLFRRHKLLSDEQQLDDLVRNHLPLELVEELLPVARAFNVIVPK